MGCNSLAVGVPIGMSDWSACIGVGEPFGCSSGNMLERFVTVETLQFARLEAKALVKALLSFAAW